MRLADETDLGLLDGDPLVVFVAFSVAVSWMMHLIPLIISLTMINQVFARTEVLVPEIAVLWLTQVWNVIVRRRQYRQLGVYRTREEYLWTYFEDGYLIGLLLVGGIICRQWWPNSITEVVTYDIDAWSITALKILMIVSIVWALYVTNKDLFIFFKAKTSDDIRQRWFDRFLQRRISQT